MVRAKTPLASMIWALIAMSKIDDGLPWATRPRDGLIDAIPQA